MLKVASHIPKLGMKVWQIIHSGKLRVKQRVESFDQHLHPVHGIEE